MAQYWFYSKLKEAIDASQDVAIAQSLYNHSLEVELQDLTYMYMMDTQELGPALEDTKKKLGPNNLEAATEFITKVNTMVNKFTEIMHQYKPYSIENAYTDFVTDYYDLLCTVKDYFKDASIETVPELVDDTTCKILRMEMEKDREQQAKCKDPRVNANIPMGTTMINRLASLPNLNQ